MRRRSMGYAKPIVGQNRRYQVRWANDSFLIRKQTLSASALNDHTWPIPAYRIATLLYGAANQPKMR